MKAAATSWIATETQLINRNKDKEHLRPLPVSREEHPDAVSKNTSLEFKNDSLDHVSDSRDNAAVEENSAVKKPSFLARLFGCLRMPGQRDIDRLTHQQFRDEAITQNASAESRRKAQQRAEDQKRIARYIASGH